EDSRSSATAAYTNELVEFLDKESSKIVVFQGWEELYLKTKSESVGGAFPLANVEPALIFDFVRNKKNYEGSTTFKKLCERFNNPDDWIAIMKREIRSKPTDFRFDSRDFAE